MAIFFFLFPHTIYLLVWRSRKHVWKRPGSKEKQKKTRKILNRKRKIIFHSKWLSINFGVCVYLDWCAFEAVQRQIAPFISTNFFFNFPWGDRISRKLCRNHTNVGWHRRCVKITDDCRLLVHHLRLPTSLFS